MKRRSFLKKLPILGAAGATFTINGIPMKLLASDHIARLSSTSDNDKVMIILQMHGGNDGLNTVIPLSNYDQYHFNRSNIAIPKNNGVRSLIELDSTLPEESKVGLHPDMMGVKQMYDQGKVSIVQGVSYHNNNGSHFRGRDIWSMGGGSEDYYSSGWIGRYLGHQYAPLAYPNDFPNSDMQDPLALELGSEVSLMFHQEGNIPTSISLGGGPEAFADLIENLEGFTDEGVDPRGTPPPFLDPSPYGEELNWILGLEDKSEDYAGRLLEVYNRSSATSVDYPESYPFNAPQGALKNRLAPQLQLIARLLDGGGDGVKTKVFLVRIGGFDTHAGQVEAHDPTMGNHAALLHHISSAMKAFQDDLRARGLEERVLTVTTSEFGRRIRSNGSYGTDHGKGGPIMMFGKGIKAGVLGVNPDQDENNVAMQYDYRQIFAGILHEWMEVDKETLENDIFFGDFFEGPKEDGSGFYEPIVLTEGVVTGEDGFLNTRFAVENVYPVPAKQHINIDLVSITKDEIGLSLYDSMGKQVFKGSHKMKKAGKLTIRQNLPVLPKGNYILKIQSSKINHTAQITIQQ